METSNNKTHLDIFKNKIKNITDLKSTNRNEIKLAKNSCYFGLYCMSDFLAGEYRISPPRINKLIAQLDEIITDPTKANVKIVLGGDLFYFLPGGQKNREESEDNVLNQATILVELLEPYKDRIIAVVDGDNERKYIEKDGINPTKILCERLGISDKYFGDSAEIDVTFQNKWTENNKATMKMLIKHGFLSSNTFATTYNKVKGSQNIVYGKDVYISTGYNKLSLFREANLKYVNGKTIKTPVYVISTPGIKDYPNIKVANRNESPANTDNGILQFFAVRNPDLDVAKGDNYIGEPDIKFCQEFLNFGRTNTVDFDYSLINRINNLQMILNSLKESICGRIETVIDGVLEQSTGDVLEQSTESKPNIDKINAINDEIVEKIKKGKLPQISYDERVVDLREGKAGSEKLEKLTELPIINNSKKPKEVK